MRSILTCGSITALITAVLVGGRSVARHASSPRSTAASACIATSDSPNPRAAQTTLTPVSWEEPEAPAMMKFTRYSIKDPGINNLECLSILVPEGWKAQSKVEWYPDLSVLANILLRITDSNTGAAVEKLPLQNFIDVQGGMPMQAGSNYMGSIVASPPQDAPQFIKSFYMQKSLRHLQGARVVDQRDLPKVAAQIAQQMGGQSEVHMTRVRYAFTYNEQPWEEDVYLSLAFTQFPGGLLWSVPVAYTFRAPAGMLDRMTPLMTATMNSGRFGEQWSCGFMYVQKLFHDRMMGGIADAAAISATITNNSDEALRMFEDTYRQQQASQDRMSENRSETMRGVNTYSNPFEDRPIGLPSGYNDAWVNSKGEYILSNQGGYDPNVGSTTEWRRMKQRGED